MIIYAKIIFLIHLEMIYAICTDLSSKRTM